MVLLLAAVVSNDIWIFNAVNNLCAFCPFLTEGTTSMCPLEVTIGVIERGSSDRQVQGERLMNTISGLHMKER